MNRQLRVVLAAGDFLVGEWRVHHRRISAVSSKWVESDGTLSLRLLMEGAANWGKTWQPNWIMELQRVE
jgi:hypothetical protein